MRAIIWILSLFILCGCKDNKQTSEPTQKQSEASTEASVAQLREDRSVEYFVEILTPQSSTHLKENEPPPHDCVKPVTGSRWPTQPVLMSVRSLTFHTIQTDLTDASHTTKLAPTDSIEPKPNVIPLSGIG